MAWKTVSGNRTQQQQQAKAAANPVPIPAPAPTSAPAPEITNEDVERMIDAIPETVLAQEAEIESTSPSPVPVHIPTDDEIANLVANLSPAQLAKTRLQMGIPAGGGFKRLPDGSVEVVIRISADTVPVLDSWAQSAGKSLEEQIQEVAEQSISSYCFRDWGTMAVDPVPQRVRGKVVRAPAPVSASVPVTVVPPAAAPGK